MFGAKVMTSPMRNVSDPRNDRHICFTVCLNLSEQKGELLDHFTVKVEGRQFSKAISFSAAQMFRVCNGDCNHLKITYFAPRIQLRDSEIFIACDHVVAIYDYHT